MKICIAGPVNTDKTFGGVGTFTESLADGFRLLSHEVYIVTDYSNKPTTIKGVPIHSVGNSPSRRSIQSILKLKKEIESIRPDVLISSLEYSFVFFFLKKSGIQRVHFMHGFRTRFLHRASMKFIAGMSDRVIANSSLTSVVNQELFHTQIDDIVNLGIGYDIYEGLLKKEQVFPKKGNTVLFAGRLVKAKNLDKLLSAIKCLHQLTAGDYRLRVAGDGDERRSLEERAKNEGLHIDFEGKKTPLELIDYYRDAKVFVSLNPHEPFGIVFLEALMAGCNIVAPYTGGHLDIAKHFQDSFFLVNPYDPASIANGIQRALESPNLDNRQTIQKEYTFERVAGDILNSIGHQ